MKKLVVGLLFVFGSGANAADGGSSASIDKKDSVEFSAGIFTGLNSIVTKQDSETSATGPFIRPNFGISTVNGPVSLNTALTLELAGQIATSDEATRSFTNGTRLQFTPQAGVGVELTDRLSFNTLGLVDTFIFTDAEESNLADWYVRPDLAFKLTEDVSIAVAYVFNRTDSFDKVSAATDSPRFNASTANSQVNPATPIAAPKESEMTALHAGQLTVKHPLSSKLKMSTYVRSGYRLAVGNDTPEFRLQSSVSGEIIPSLTTSLTYRFNIGKKPTNYSYYNRGYINFDYALNETWAIATENVLSGYKSTAWDNSVKLELDNYVGAKYTF